MLSRRSAFLRCELRMKAVNVFITDKDARTGNHCIKI